MAEMHLSDGIEKDEDDFYRPRCTCGWKGEYVPDLETLVDEMMDHARMTA